MRRVTSGTAQTRNSLMIDLADEVVIAYACETGNLRRLRDERKGNKIFNSLA